MAKNPLLPNKSKKIKFQDVPHSAGILDDYAVRKNIATREGTITKTPVDDYDIANKKYVDDNAGGVGGADTQVQFNDNGVLEGNAGHTFDKATGKVSATIFNTTSVIQAGGNQILATEDADTGGTNCIFIGKSIAPSNNAGNDNIGIGFESLNKNTTGDNNLAIGYGALYTNTTGSTNLALGKDAGYTFSGKINNSFIGYRAGRYANGNYNVGIGVESCGASSSGVCGNNTFIGVQAGRGVVGGDFNIGIGQGALYTNAAGSWNVAIGYSALNKLNGAWPDGNYNTAIGYRAGYNAVDSVNCVFIGCDAGYNETGDHKLYIDSTNTSTPLIYGEFDNDLLKFHGRHCTPKQSKTLGVGVTTFAVTSNVVEVTGDGGGNTIATITGGLDGQILTLIFVDANVAITDDNTHAANSVDLSAAFTSADDTVLQLVYDGTSWYEVSRSVN